jgi:hypothetical protein
MSRTRLIQHYEAELRDALRWQEQGRSEVHATVAGSGLAKGRATVPITEYIQHWRNGLDALRAGADPELWEY